MVYVQQGPDESLDAWSDRVRAIAKEAYRHSVQAQEKESASLVVRGCNDEGLVAV